MRPLRLLAALRGQLGLFAIGCGWSPPGPAPTSTQACGSTDAPSPEVVSQAIAGLPQAQWKESARGNTPDCRLNWVVVTAGDASDSPMQVLFFDRNNPLGPATPEPRTYINVISTGKGHRAGAIPVATGSGSGLLPDRHRHGPLPGRRGRQDQVA